ncbi:MAG: helix-turn-helix transcriptional regulator [Clostridia bacterium]|nr:helix-turn-helix transcriptional regulator [Clostridia bacterium]
MKQQQQTEEFRVWFRQMKKKHNICQRQFCKKMNFHEAWFSRIMNGKLEPTDSVMFKTAIFFEKRYNETSFSRKFRTTNAETFREWIDIIVKRYDISDYEIAEVIGTSASSVKAARIGEGFSKEANRRKILNYLFNEYGIDVTEGRKLINCVVEPGRQETAEWIKETMHSNSITAKQLTKELEISESRMSTLINGKAVLSKERAEKIFSFFEENGIDTSEGREKYQLFYEKQTN